MILLEAKVGLQQQLHHAIRIQRLRKLSTSRPVVILKYCGHQIAFDYVLHQRLINIVDEHVLLGLPPLGKDMANTLIERLNKSRTLRVFITSKREAKFDVVKEVDVEENERIRKRLKRRQK